VVYAAHGFLLFFGGNQALGGRKPLKDNPLGKYKINFLGGTKHL